MNFSDSELLKILPVNGPDIKEAKKYLNKYKDQYICIKVGGSVLNDETLFNILIEDISLLRKINFNPILIHGGGKRLTNKLNELNIKTNFIDGLRVTDEKVINIVENVFLDFNKEIVNAIKNNSSKARAFTSKENNIINVKSISKKLGFVGTPNNIDLETLKKIISQKEIPVIAPLGLNSDNQVFNINADEVATSIASSINARRLLIVSDVEGVLDKDNNLISEINSSKAQEMIEEKIISGGMIPKINNAIKIAGKVKGTVIISGKKPHSVLFELLSDNGSGTLIKK